MRFLYTKIANEILQGGAGDLSASALRVLLLNSSYTPNQAHEYLDDIPIGSRVYVTNDLSGLLISNGKLMANDYEIVSLTGDPITQLVFYNHTGTESTSQLFIYDSSSVGLPFTPIGEDFTLDFGVNGIIDLARIL
jgi:hypothetical protein